MAELQPFQITRSQHELMLKRERPPMKSGAQLASAYSPLLNRCCASLTSAGVSAMCAPRSDSLCGVSIGCALIHPHPEKIVRSGAKKPRSYGVEPFLLCSVRPLAFPACRADHLETRCSIGLAPLREFLVGGAWG
jgi:hypothetical protein